MPSVLLFRWRSIVDFLPYASVLFCICSNYLYGSFFKANTDSNADLKIMVLLKL